MDNKKRNISKPINFAATIQGMEFFNSKEYIDAKRHFNRFFGKDELSVEQMQLAKAAEESRKKRLDFQKLQSEISAFDKAYTENLRKSGGIRAFVGKAIDRGITLEEVENGEKAIYREDNKDREI